MQLERFGSIGLERLGRRRGGVARRPGAVLVRRDCAWFACIV